MTQIPGPDAGAGADEAEPIVVVGRTVGGLVLILVGLVLALAGAFVYFITPWIAPWTEEGGIWWTLSDLDFVGAIVGGLGLVLAFIGGGLVQRARKRKLEMFIDPAQVAGTLREVSDDAVPGETRTGDLPRTIL